MKLLRQIKPEWSPICILLMSVQILYYFISKAKREIIFKYTQKEMKNLFFKNKIFQLAKRQLIYQNSIKHEPMIRCFKSAERNDRICDCVQLVSNFTHLNQQISKANGRISLSKQHNFRVSPQKKQFCMDRARQTSVVNFGLDVAEKKMAMPHWHLKPILLLWFFHAALYSNKIMFWINSNLFVYFTVVCTMRRVKEIMNLQLWLFYENVWNFSLTLMFSLLH